MEPSSLQENGNSIGILIADVSGHGLPGAFFSMIAKIAFENIPENNTPEDVLKKLNETIFKASVNKFFITMFYTVINFKTKKMIYSNAGHFPQFIYRQKDDKFYYLNPKGVPLGWFKEIDPGEKTFTLEKNDRVIMYTDGVLECMDSKSNLFGEDRFKEFITDNINLSPKEFSDQLITFLKTFSHSDEFDDDICLIVFDVL